MEETAELIKRLRDLGAETDDVEVKAAANGVPKSLRSTISAFSNDNGGTVLLGLTDPKDGATPAEGFDAGKIRDGMADMLANDIEPRVFASIDIENIGDYQVVRVDVPEGEFSSKPYFIKAAGAYGGSYTRIGDGERRLSEYEVSRLRENRTEPRHDREIITAASLDDLDELQVQQLLLRLRTSQPKAFADLDDLTALRRANIIHQAEDGAFHPTLAGLLSLGEYPQEFFPQLFISVVVWPTPQVGELGPGGLRFLDDRDCSGPIPAMIADATDTIIKNMTRASSIGQGELTGFGRTDQYEYPIEVIRELIANAVMHRDYSPESRGAQVKVELFPDRLEVTSPGGFYGPVAPATAADPDISSSRNSFLSRILADVPYPFTMDTVVENRGSGLPRVLHALNSAGMQPPYFHADLRRVKVTVPQSALMTPQTLAWIHSLQLTEITQFQAQALAAMRRGHHVANATLQSWGLSPTDATAQLGDLVSRGLAERVGERRWATYVLDSSIPTTTPEQDLAEAAIAPEPLTETPTERKLSPRASTIMELLTAHGRLRAKQVEELLGYSRSSVNNHLRKLIDEGLVRATAPANSPRRQYELTAR